MFHQLSNQSLNILPFLALEIWWVLVLNYLFFGLSLLRAWLGGFSCPAWMREKGSGL